MKIKDLTIEQIAELGLWTDDPFGDGIRLEAIRNPRPARLAAARVASGIPQFFDEDMVREEYIPQIQNWTTKAGHLNAAIRRNAPTFKNQGETP